MGYSLEAIVGPTAALSLVARDVVSAVVVPLRQGMGLVPVTDRLVDEVAGGGSAASLGFWRFPGGFDRLLRGWSGAGPLAYVEAEFFGGVGSQRAAVWSGGALVFGPVALGEGQLVPVDGTPISQALAWVGVTREGVHDEFDSVDLGRHRHTEDWLP
ncbi:hypothetical protein [Pseudofrankia sp. BMG5.36]|uniref:hypothetical protein n=1 Tax=Pseudofrankia sp. BMG5.36 TaxID=1834512 RepID=UPI0008D9416E|nr:hypothetical protein [Pseudofrankia sp. BMG5.36]OHV62980.1 hypothetical protein BCD48_38790 [Pseudofrankia sp. BMG5.36]